MYSLGVDPAIAEIAESLAELAKVFWPNSSQIGRPMPMHWQASHASVASPASHRGVRQLWFTPELPGWHYWCGTGGERKPHCAFERKRRQHKHASVQKGI
jgi:hypothetical protein